MEIVEGNIENFDELISKGPVLVDFFATWCGPCKMLSSEIENVLNQSYPFKINISSDKEVIDGKGGAAKFIVNVSWPYETLDDNGELKDLDDTYWGNKAYQYTKSNPETPCIQLNVKLSATQMNK